MTIAKEKIRSNFEDNKILRADDFFSELDNRTSAEELIQALQDYFAEMLKQKKNVIQNVVHEFQRIYKAKDET